ncbi:MAG TPA: phosphatase PAP2 family protein [Solirubrobacteraceae bacterium]|nr:phosphatase PAP2 family protein [Solirubrobacteraceae bacterium]
MARGVATALAGAAHAAALALAVWVLVFHVEAAQRADAAGLHAAGRAGGTWAPAGAEWLARLADRLPYALLVACLLVFALRARGLRGVIVAGAIVGAANVATQYLKPALATPRPFLTAADHVAAASWPSGHATAAAALALAAVVVAPRRRRRAVAAAGALYALVVACSVIVLGWHLPSDAVGGFAVAGCAACLGVAALRRASGAPARRRARPAPAREPA